MTTESGASNTQLVATKVTDALALVVPEGTKQIEPSPQTIPKRLVRMSDSLEAASKVPLMRERPRGFRRPVKLNIQGLHDRLVVIYTEFFTQQWPIFGRVSRLMQNNPATGADSLAKAYVAAWIQDLYVCLYRAVSVTCGDIRNQHYPYPKFDLVMPECDTYLAVLNTMIRPTLVQSNHEETMYVPYFEHHDFTKQSNYFEINAWNYNYSFVQGIIGVMREKRQFSVSPLNPSAVLARAGWLLDWWNAPKRALAWFHQEGNYSVNDLMPFYILGIQVTATKMAPQDRDRLQRFEGNTIPAQIRVEMYRRIDEQTIHGGVEERVIDLVDDNENPFVEEVPDPAATQALKTGQASSAMVTPKKRKLTTATVVTMFQVNDSDTLHMYRIVDYIYNDLVFQFVDTDSQTYWHSDMIMGRMVN